jgi:hypothetical protein
MIIALVSHLNNVCSWLLPWAFCLFLFLMCALRIVKYLGRLHINYIIYRNVENFKRILSFKEQSFVKENKESFEILKNILFFHMPSSKIIIYRSRLSRLMITIYFLEFQFLKKVFA